jgi:hypothetical protein
MDQSILVVPRKKHGGGIVNCEQKQREREREQKQGGRQQAGTGHRVRQAKPEAKLPDDGSV